MPKSNAPYLDRYGRTTSNEEHERQRYLKRAILHKQLPFCTWTRRNKRQRCGSWRCPSCRLYNARERRRLIADDLLFPPSLDVWARAFTITNDQGLHLDDYQRAWKKLSRQIRGQGLAWERCYWVLGISPTTGRLHRHVITIGGPFLHHAKLRTFAEKAGVGYVHAQALNTPDDRRGAATYHAINAVEYAIAHQQSDIEIRPVSPRPGDR